jgi:hypothetical protein
LFPRKAVKFTSFFHSLLLFYDVFAGFMSRNDKFEAMFWTVLVVSVVGLDLNGLKGN